MHDDSSTSQFQDRSLDPPQSAHAKGTEKRYRVLLVEDELEIARMALRYLRWYEPAQFEVEHEQDLGSALHRLEEETFDAMILDLALPDAQGLETLTGAAILVRNIPIVVFTATEEEDVFLYALRAGFQGYLSKPTANRQTLPRSVIHAIDHHRRAQQKTAAQGV